MLRTGRLALFGFAVAPFALLAAVGDQGKPTFAQDVAPILKAHCASCHAGPNASAGLDLTTTAGIKKVVTPKGSKDSLLIQRLRGIGGAQMPMGFAPLPEATISKIAAWIDNGADFGPGIAKHWAYQKPTKPPVPKLSSTWIRNPIDAFVLQRLRKEGLHPSPEAGKETLLRRVYLDLIGLPPSPREIDAFLADRRPDAYERVVDDLMKNPHYGERQAEPWLDLSRYADSDGYEKDLNRTAWKYRDWLISAFDRNLPYDRFTIEQLAGDLIPNATQDQLIATGFNRNTMFNREGGVDQEEAHFNVILDRVGTTATVWLGSTLQCARCHDHKYDPFTQKDFYRFSAFFSNSLILPEGSKEVGEEKWFESSMPAPTPEQAARETALKAQIVEADRRMNAWSPAIEAAYRQWRKESVKGPQWTVLQPDKLESRNGATLAADGFGVITSTGLLPASDDYTVTAKSGLTHLTGISVEAIADPSLPSYGPGRSANGNFVINKVKLVLPGGQVKFSKAVADYDQPDFEASKLFGKDPNVGWAVNGAEGKSHELVLELDKPIDVAADTPIQIVLEQHWSGGQHILGKFRVSLTSSEHPVMLFLPPKIRQLMSVAEQGDAGDKALREYFSKLTPLLDEDRSKLTSLKAKLARLEAAIPTALVMRDKPVSGPLTAFIHSRGEFLSPTDPVTSGFPAILAPETNAAKLTATHQLKSSDSKPERAAVPHINVNGKGAIAGPVLTRLNLAKWLASRDNPLSARVEANRLWEQFFGRGIVETSEDFGTQGSRPSHPELLDWLACSFMDKGWDMKAMVRLIVTSSTYRQSSAATAASEEKDPHNILLARGPRVRLDAETIRDTILSASGLLSTKIGGPSVFPYQPANVWDTPYNGEQWMESKGGDRYRRGLYTFVKRSSPYPSSLSFDGTTRESCTVRRIRTNTPLQALAMLNDQAVFDAAKALGERMLKEPANQRIAFGFRLCTGRRPTKAEADRLTALLNKLEARYSKDQAAAKKLAGTPALAAWTMVANVLLNLDETVTKG